MEDILFSENLAFQTFIRQHDYHNLQPHTPRHYLAYIEEGRCRLAADRIILEARAGDVFYIPKGLQYQSDWFCDRQIRFKSFGFHYFPEAAAQQYPMQVIPCAEDIKARLRDYPMEAPIDSRLLGAFYTILAELLPAMQYREQPSWAVTFEKARQYISQNTGCHVADIARHCAISQAALYDIFRANAGCTPNELRQQVLCQQAVLLLSTTDRSVQDISDSLGFSSTSYFRKILREHTGKSPREIRRSGGRI